jgi:MFS family permease
MHKRYSAFYLLGSLASACAGILAFGLMQMNGIRGYSGWRWIFIIEGVLSICVGIVGYFALVDFPDGGHENWHFLSKRETKLIVAKVNKDRGDAHTESFHLKKFLGAGLDLKIWGFA